MKVSPVCPGRAIIPGMTFGIGSPGGVAGAYVGRMTAGPPLLVISTGLLPTSGLGCGSGGIGGAGGAVCAQAHVTSNAARQAASNPHFTM